MKMIPQILLSSCMGAISYITGHQRKPWMINGKKKFNAQRVRVQDAQEMSDIVPLQGESV